LTAEDKENLRSAYAIDLNEKGIPTYPTTAELWL